MRVPFYIALKKGDNSAKGGKAQTIFQVVPRSSLRKNQIPLLLPRPSGRRKISMIMAFAACEENTKKPASSAAGDVFFKDRLGPLVHLLGICWLSYLQLL